MIDAVCTDDCAECPLTPHLDCPGKFEFNCSCEISLSGNLWCCDVCSTTLDPTGQLVTEESERILGFDTLVPRYRSEAHAIACGVTEEQIIAERDRALEARITLIEAQRAQVRTLDPMMLGHGRFESHYPF